MGEEECWPPCWIPPLNRPLRRITRPEGGGGALELLAFIRELGEHYEGVHRRGDAKEAARIRASLDRCGMPVLTVVDIPDGAPSASRRGAQPGIATA